MTDTPTPPEDLAAQIAALREKVGRLGAAGRAVAETFTTRDVLLEYEGSQDFGLMPDYGTVGKDVAQELMAALNDAATALPIIDALAAEIARLKRQLAIADPDQPYPADLLPDAGKPMPLIRAALEGRPS